LLALSRSFWLGGGGKFGIGGDQDAQPVGLVRAEPVYQVMQVVIVMSRCHRQ
jgi:hypothetical protein